MRLAALSGGMSVLAMLLGNDLVRSAAQIQLAHAMATLACATIMNIGGRQARWAPGFFLPGTLVFCGARYAAAAGAPPWAGAVQWPGAMLLLAGWGILAWAAGSIDRPERAKRQHSDLAPSRKEASLAVG